MNWNKIKHAWLLGRASGRKASRRQKPTIDEKELLKIMLDWHDDCLKNWVFKIPLDHEQSEFYRMLANHISEKINNK